MEQLANHHTKYISKIIPGIRLIGGCVRDALLGKEPSDFDFAAPITPDETIATFRNLGLRYVDYASKFGTIKLILDHKEYEITSLRSDISCDGRYAVVSFTDDFFIDSLRRDFTINALSYDLAKSKLYDFHNGVSDLKNYLVKFIGDPYARIKEDFLRIFRFFRFSMQYAKSFNKEGLDACLELKDGIKIISLERIKFELDKILKYSKPFHTIEAMKSVLEVLFSSINLDPKMDNPTLNYLDRYSILRSVELNFSKYEKNYIKKANLYLKRKDLAVIDWIYKKEIPFNFLKLHDSFFTRLEKAEMLDKFQAKNLISSGVSIPNLKNVQANLIIDYINQMTY